jgi:hypothetical protein
MTRPLEGGPDLPGLRQAVARHAATVSDAAAAYRDLGWFIDAAGDAGDEAALLGALDLAERIEPLCDPVHACLVRYGRSNAWACLREIRTNDQSAWSWTQPELLQQIYWLRAAVQHEGYADLPRLYKAQIHCNLGNALSSAGRFVESLAQWRRALVEQPTQGMARGNLGEGLITYARAVHDAGHAVLFLQQSQRELNAAVTGGVGTDGVTYPAALNHFASMLQQVNGQLREIGAQEFELSSYSLGRSKRERVYREWALRERLFLNPLNDLVTESIAAGDVLMLPSHRVRPSGITFLAFFNQLKQEYAFARWNLFEGTTQQRTHLADREVALAFNADYALYSMALEQVKVAYRCAYSLFDKIAYFINDYWKLGIPERGVSFRSVWVEQVKGKATPQVRAVLAGSQNLPLRGLFWLSKDLFEAELKDVAQPDARDLDALRNHFEHKYVKVVDALAHVAPPSEPFVDRLAHQVVREDLVRKTMRLLQLTRSALIYLSLAMEVEEQRSVPSEGLTMPFPVDVYPDSLKR